MAQQFTYNYAIIDLETGLCMETRSTSSERTEEEFIPIPEYNTDYIFKYYNRENGKWYEDAAFTTEWSPA